MHRFACLANQNGPQDIMLAMMKFEITTLAVQQQVSAMMIIVGLFGDQTIIVATRACNIIFGTNQSAPNFS